MQAAAGVVRTWMTLPQARILLPGEDHAGKVLELMAETMGSGALVSDASLAVHAIQNRATLCKNDSDFARFRGLVWHNPLV